MFASGATVDFADNVVGYGTIQTPNNVLKPMIVNGDVRGNSNTEPLTFTGYVKGVDTFDDVTFAGTHSPGLSVAMLHVGDVTYGETSTLLIELGGGGSHVGFDQINSDGTLRLDGTLQVALLAPVGLSLGQSFDILTADDAILGEFDSLVLPALDGGLALGVLYGPHAVTLRVVADTEGDFNFDGFVDGRDFLGWQRGDSPDPLSAGDLADWKANFGTGPHAAQAAAAVPEPTSLAMRVGLLLLSRCAPMAWMEQKSLPGRGRRRCRC